MTCLPGRLARADFLKKPPVMRVLALLNRDGEEARIVGGAVRNALMGLPISDIDIATTALPDEVMARARRENIHAVPTGIEHGTVTLVVDGAPHEVTTLREDVETDGRRARVRFGRDFSHDAFRRDFTINALSVEADGSVHDYADGMADIAARRVRFIGDADQRIREDYLRILRLFRFSAAYGDGSVDAEGLAAAIRNRAGLEGLSRERVRQEMVKLIVARQAVAVIGAMERDGFLTAVLGGAADVVRFARLAALEADLGLKPDSALRLAALAVFSTGDVTRLREALRLTNVEVSRMETVLATGGQTLSPGEPALRVRLYRLGADAYRDCVLAGWAAAGAAADNPAWVSALSLPGRLPVPPFRISGKDIMSAGVPKGPMVGRILAAVEDDWIAAGMPEDEADQRAILRAVMEE